MEKNNVAVYEHKQVLNVEESAMSIDSLLKQVALIQNVMQKVMRPDEHYGTIPGTKKPTLLKAGAEKLCLVFRLEPKYEIIEKIKKNDFISYVITCRLSHSPTNQPVSSGIGSCNSKEIKYRYRNESTGNVVPKEYWKTRDSSMLGGKGFTAKKENGEWIIHKKVENENPWDLDNTLLKMACKRALVAATLNATAASDIFTQDMEDMVSKTTVQITNTQKKAILEKMKESLSENDAILQIKKDGVPNMTESEANIYLLGLNAIKEKSKTENMPINMNGNKEKLEPVNSIDGQIESLRKKLNLSDDVYFGSIGKLGASNLSELSDTDKKILLAELIDMNGNKPN